MLGGIGNLANIMKSAKDLQANMASMQAALADKRFDAQAGGGMVKIIVDGKGTLVDVRIDPKAVADVELLEDLIKSAVGAAVKLSQDALQQEVSKITGGLGLPPGMADMLGGNS